MNISVGNIVLPNTSLTNFDLMEGMKKLKVPNFRGVFTRDALPAKPERNECGLLNLDSSAGRGTHWVAWWKRGDMKLYFDSYGIVPPNELVIWARQSITTLYAYSPRTL